jgi:alpha/beta hydrolase fold
VVAVNYVLFPARFPGQLHDLKAAVRWLRGNGPRLGLLIERIGIWGASVGAYLGSLLALTTGIDRFEGTVGGHFGQSSAAQAVVHWFGQSDLVASGSRTEVEARLLPFTFEAGLLGVADIADAAGCLMFGSARWIRGVRVSEGCSEATAAAAGWSDAPSPGCIRRPRQPCWRSARRCGENPKMMTRWPPVINSDIPDSSAD